MHVGLEASLFYTAIMPTIVIIYTILFKSPTKTLITAKNLQNLQSFIFLIFGAFLILTVMWLFIDRNQDSCINEIVIRDSQNITYTDAIVEEIELLCEHHKRETFRQSLIFLLGMGAASIFGAWISNNWKIKK